MSDPKDSTDPASWDEADESRLREMLESAGPRPEAPAEDLAAIKQAFRAEWKQQYGKSQPAAATEASNEEPAEAPARPLFGEESRPRASRSPVSWRGLALAASLAMALGSAWWWLPSHGLCCWMNRLPA